MRSLGLSKRWRVWGFEFTALISHPLLSKVGAAKQLALGDRASQALQALGGTWPCIKFGNQNGVPSRATQLILP